MELKEKIYGVFGAGGFGREVMPLLQKQLEVANDTKKVFFVSEIIAPQDNSIVNETKLISYDDFLSFYDCNKFISVAIADNIARRRITENIIAKGISPITVQAQNCILLSNVEIETGAIICPFVTLTSNISIGKSFHANVYSYVAHDCIIGDYVTFAPNVKCNGNVIIEDDVYVGTGAIIKQGTKNNPIRIGKGAKISAGSFVTKNVKAGLTVMGNPAVPLNKSALKRR
jgi:sugar O-acyltransferase (sialic acid O-acetyltransferase NeuD family)